MAPVLRWFGAGAHAVGTPGRRRDGRQRQDEVRPETHAWQARSQSDTTSVPRRALGNRPRRTCLGGRMTLSDERLEQIMRICFPDFGIEIEPDTGIVRLVPYKTPDDGERPRVQWR